MPNLADSYISIPLELLLIHLIAVLQRAPSCINRAQRDVNTNGFWGDLNYFDNLWHKETPRYCSSTIGFSARQIGCMISTLVSAISGAHDT